MKVIKPIRESVSLPAGTWGTIQGLSEKSGVLIQLLEKQDNKYKS